MADQLPDWRKRSRRDVWSPGSEYWRHKAEEARTICAEARDPRVQETMEGIAQTYDRLAERAEKIEGLRKPH